MSGWAGGPGVPWLFAALAAGLARVALPQGLQMIRSAGFVRRNFAGRAVPAGAGLLVVLVYAAALIVWNAVQPSTVVQTLLFVAVAMGFVGFVDDVLGDKSAQGLRGHLRLLLRGGLSTGGLKAVFGALVGFAAARTLARDAYGLVVGAMFIALASNVVNLLDLRPGRALKGAALLGLVLFSASTGRDVWRCTLPMWAALAVYAPYDLKARAMLGDAGANAVGAVLGAAAVAAMPPGALTIGVIAMSALHVWTERGSISRAVERVPALKWLDDWGRR